MVNRRQRDEMRDYLIAKLDGSGQKVRPVRMQTRSGITSTHLVVDESAVILLVDQPYTDQGFRDFREAVRVSKPGTPVQFVPVFYKDGETFFRSATRDKKFKQSLGLSLKNYTNERMQKMLLFKPEEVAATRDTNWVQYYQPQSERLEQGVVSFNVYPVVFDYSHIDAEDRIGPIEQTSKKLYLWGEKSESIGCPLKVSGMHLVSRV